MNLVSSKLRGLFLLVTLVFLASSTININAATDIRKKIDHTKKQIVQKKRKEKSVLDNLIKTQKELDQINAKLKKLNVKVGNYKKRLNTVDSDIKELQVEMEIISKEIIKQQGVLSQRLVTIYKNGYQNYLEILFKAKDFGEFINRCELVGDLVKYELKVLHDFGAYLEEINDKKQLIIDKQSELEHEKIIYDRLCLESKKQKQKLAAKSKNEQKELANIKKDRRKLEKALDELVRLSKSMEAKIKEYQKKNRNAGGSGNLIELKPTLSL